MRWFSLGRVIFWLALTWPAWYFGWLDSVVFVSFLSLWALVETAFAAWRADENPEPEAMVALREDVAALRRLLEDRSG
jgi:hypothetical protein